MSTSGTTLAEAELGQIGRANASGRTPVVFVHGLWLLARSWDRWRGLFEARGYAAVAPGWPAEPETVDIGRDRPELFAGLGIGDVVAHHVGVIDLLTRRPVVIGHSFGGLVAQVLAGRGLAAASVVIDPAPGRGVLPLPVSALRAAFPVLRNPAHRRGAVMLTYPQFRYAFANAVGDDEARELYATYAVPGSGRPLFQAALANLDPRTEAYADPRHPRRGPMKFLSGEKDNSIPPVLVDAAYKRQQRNTFPTEIERVPGRGHSLVFDHCWQDVAERALAFTEHHTRTA